MAIYSRWIKVSNYLPKEGQRVLTFSPNYPKENPMRLRMMDGQFLRLCGEVTHWMLVGEPSND